MGELRLALLHMRLLTGGGHGGARAGLELVDEASGRAGPLLGRAHRETRESTAFTRRTTSRGLNGFTM